MSEALIRADLKNVLDTLDAAGNIGLVHDYERWALQSSAVMAVLRDPSFERVQSWMIFCQGFSPVQYHYEQGPPGKATVVREYQFMVRGVRAVDDANESDKTFFALVESVCNALDTDTTLHNQDRYWGETPACSLGVYEVRSFAGVLCHVAEINQVVTATVAIA